MKQNYKHCRNCRFHCVVDGKTYCNMYNNGKLIWFPWLRGKLCKWCQD